MRREAHTISAAVLGALIGIFLGLTFGEYTGLSKFWLIVLFTPVTGTLGWALNDPRDLKTIIAETADEVSTWPRRAMWATWRGIRYAVLWLIAATIVLSINLLIAHIANEFGYGLLGRPGPERITGPDLVTLKFMEAMIFTAIGLFGLTFLQDAITPRGGKAWRWWQVFYMNPVGAGITVLFIVLGLLLAAFLQVRKFWRRLPVRLTVLGRIAQRVFIRANTHWRVVSSFAAVLGLIVGIWTSNLLLGVLVSGIVAAIQVFVLRPVAERLSTA